jgi:hypothetical protein
MAYTESPLFLTLPSSGTLATHQYKLVDVSTAGQTEVVITDVAPGIGINHGNTTGTGIGVPVQFAGVSPLYCGNSTTAAINPGDLLTASTGGMAIPAAGTSVFIIGEALESLTSGSSGIIAVKLILAHGAT